MKRWLLIAAALFAATAEAQFVTPNENLVVDGLPPIPTELAEKVSAFGNYPSASHVTWLPAKGMIVRARSRQSMQLFTVSEPGAKPEPLTDFPDAVAVGVLQPGTAEHIVFPKGKDGNEVFQLFCMNLATKKFAAITDGRERASSPAWNRTGDRLVYASSSIDKRDADEDMERVAEMKLILVDPLNPTVSRTITSFKGRSFGGFQFSPDDKTLLMREGISANESHLWLLNVESGQQRRLTAAPTGREPVYYTGAEFSTDGKRVFAISDRDNEFRRLVGIDVATGKEEPLGPQFKFDVTGFVISEKAKRVALLTNEEGSSVLRLLDLETFKELPRPPLFQGEISGLRWNGGRTDEKGDGKLLAFNMVSARSPGAVFVLNIETARLTRWTTSSVRGASPVDFVEPRIVKWKSFDGLSISGLLYQPDAQKFPGKRPVIINIHGGPESQARPGFMGRSNYLLNELGIVLILPNVRGSSGFGKTFLTLDNGRKREDSVKDIGALLDWIKDQPELDAERVLVMGGSYGGYMSLAVATHYSERIAGAIDSVGISNFVTFLTNTESYRRDLRRVEYGDERDPDMRKFLEKISPLNNAEKIKKPLFVVQGKNDPRVPYTEAEQIVAQLKKQKTPVWFLMAKDEGHGFAKKANSDYLFLAQIKFLEQTLLK